MRILAVIPSRLASTRLPEKPLKDIAGKSLVQRVWEMAKGVPELTDIVVATDNETIFNHVESFGGTAVMTSESFSTGSERVYGAAQILGNGDPEQFDIILNIQGDMPLLPREAVSRLIQFLLEHRDRFQMATIATPITEEERFLSNSVVKVVVTETGEGLYFSRAPIPFPRDASERRSVKTSAASEPVFGFKHLGLYAFTAKGLSAYNSPAQSSLEQIEKLEQLRVLERGNRIGVVVIEEALMRDSVEVDTPDDLARASEIARGRG